MCICYLQLKETAQPQVATAFQSIEKIIKVWIIKII
jgi:hypothetical protein